MNSLLFTLILSCTALKMTAQLIEISPTNKAYNYPEFIEAQDFYKKKQPDKVEEKLQLVLQKLKDGGHSEDYLELLYNIGKNSLNLFRTDEALETFKKVRNLSKTYNLPDQEAEAIQALNVIYTYKNNNEARVELLQEAVKIKGLSDKNYANSCSSLASLLRGRSKLDSAIYYADQAYSIDKKLNDTISIPTTCSILASIYIQKTEYETALNYLLEGEKHLQKKITPRHIGYYYDIATVMLNLGNVDKAKFYINKGIELADENGYKSTQSFLYPTLGEVSELEGNYEEALEHYRKGEKLKRRKHKKRLDIIYPVGIISCKLNLNQKVSKTEIDSLLTLEKTANDSYLRSKIRLQHLGYQAQNGVILSAFDKQYSDLSADLLDKGFLYILKDLHNTAYKYYTEKKEYKSAINSLNQFVEYENQLYSERQNHRILDIEAKYNKEVDKRTILQLSESNETQANILRQRTIYLVSFGIGLILISLLSFFLFKYYSKVRSQNTLISKSLKEKDFLLREIHHRVKNNLQVISSLLSLQARQIDDQDIQKAINEGRSRVRSMALIHQNLYQNENLSGVSVEMYLSNLLKELFSTYSIDENKIKLDLDIEEINLDVDTMVPFGLILNELVSNCLKHAFPGGREGNIKISLKDIDNVLNLSVVDNGVGIGNEIDFQESKTFGNRLIKAFTKKLNADLEVLNKEGTTINIKIRNYKRA